MALRTLIPLANFELLDKTWFKKSATKKWWVQESKSKFSYLIRMGSNYYRGNKRNSFIFINKPI